MASNTTCLYTQVKNISGKQMIFDILPPHGKTLASGADYFFFGDFYSRLLTGGGRLVERKRKALENALLNGLIEIIQSPPPFFYDTVSSDVKTIQVSGGTLGITNPCWGGYSGAS